MAGVRLIGFEGRFNDGAFWSVGSAAIEHGDVLYNAATGHIISDEEWQKCIDRTLVGVCPEPVDLWPRPLSAVTGANAPFVLAYHFDDDRIQQVLAPAAKDVADGPARAVVFDAPKHEGAQWMVFYNYGHYRRFGAAAAEAMFEMLGDLPDEELAFWFNPVSIVSGLCHNDPDVWDFRRRVGRAFHDHLKQKRSQT